MKTTIGKKISILGMILVGASAVTAAIIPSQKSDDARFAKDGTLTAAGTSVALQTCRIAATGSIPTCHDTVGTASATTVNNPGTSATNLDSINTTANDTN